MNAVKSGESEPLEFTPGANIVIVLEEPWTTSIIQARGLILDNGGTGVSLVMCLKLLKKLVEKFVQP